MPIKTKNLFFMETATGAIKAISLFYYLLLLKLVDFYKHWYSRFSR